jgi:PTH2 family peptidyl-tRNA hydrolase
MIGQAKSLGLFGGSPVSTPSQRKEKAGEESDESSDEDDEDDTAPADFKGNHEECKMVLVVRTDLGMTKGMSYVSTRHREHFLTRPRQNWRTMWTRDPGLLQALPPHRSELAGTTTLGISGSGKGGSAGQERGGTRGSAGTSTELGTGGAYHPRCRSDTDCEWKRNGTGNRTCTEERDRSGYGTSEAAVELES